MTHRMWTKECEQEDGSWLLRCPLWKYIYIFIYPNEEIVSSSGKKMLVDQIYKREKVQSILVSITLHYIFTSLANTCFMCSMDMFLWGILSIKIVVNVHARLVSRFNSWSHKVVASVCFKDYMRQWSGRKQQKARKQGTCRLVPHWNLRASPVLPVSHRTQIQTDEGIFGRKRRVMLIKRSQHWQGFTTIHMNFRLVYIVSHFGNIHGDWHILVSVKKINITCILNDRLPWINTTCSNTNIFCKVLKGSDAGYSK